MLIALLLGTATIAVSMGIQVLAVVVMVRQITHYQANNEINGDFRIDAVILSIVLTVMFAGHILQIAIWALLFVFCGNLLILRPRFITRPSILPRSVTAI